MDRTPDYVLTDLLSFLMPTDILQLRLASKATLLKLNKCLHLHLSNFTEFLTQHQEDNSNLLSGGILGALDQARKGVNRLTLGMVRDLTYNPTSLSRENLCLATALAYPGSPSKNWQRTLTLVGRPDFLTALASVDLEALMKCKGRGKLVYKMHIPTGNKALPKNTYELCSVISKFGTAAHLLEKTDPAKLLSLTRSRKLVRSIAVLQRLVDKINSS